MIHDVDPTRPEDSYNEMIKNLEDLATRHQEHARQLHRTSGALKREGHHTLAAQYDEKAAEQERIKQDTLEKKRVLEHDHLQNSLKTTAVAPRGPRDKM